MPLVSVWIGDDLILSIWSFFINYIKARNIKYYNNKIYYFNLKKMFKKSDLNVFFYLKITISDIHNKVDKNL